MTTQTMADGKTSHGKVNIDRVTAFFYRAVARDFAKKFNKEEEKRKWVVIETTIKSVPFFAVMEEVTN